MLFKKIIYLQLPKKQLTTNTNLMKKLSLLFCLIYFSSLSAQDHFSGINTSPKMGFLSVGTNPAELSNLSSKYEVNIFALSVNFSNDKVGFQDIVKGTNIEDLIFKDGKPVNLRLDAEVYGPSFAMKINKWAVGITSKAYVKLNLVDVDPSLGDAIISGINNATVGTTSTISNDYNQRMNGTSWGELGFSVARNLFENEKHKFNAGVTMKLLFPGSYTNTGLDKFNGKITTNIVAQEVYLNNTTANLNIAYSGNLSNSFTNFSDYSQTLFGKLNGIGADLGLNYQLKDKNGYKLNTGISVRNIGAMTFKDPGNSATNYSLNIQSTLANPNGLGLSAFENVSSLDEVKTILQNKGYLTNSSPNNDFKVKLPTTISFYADLKLTSKFFVSVYTKQKLGDDNQNDQITTQNTTSITPRFSLKNFELYSSWAKNEISGTTGGLGLRLYGFYLGSSSIVTALVSDTKQADLYLGYRIALR